MSWRSYRQAEPAHRRHALAHRGYVNAGVDSQQHVWEHVHAYSVAPLGWLLIGWISADK